MKSGMYIARSGSHAKCSFCGGKLEDGDLYVRLTFHRVWPYIHHKCLKNVSDKLEAKKPELKKQFDKAMAAKTASRKAHQDKLRAQRKKRNWKRSIVKEALKTQSILVSKISVRNPIDYGTRGEGNFMALGSKGGGTFCFVRQNEAEVRVIHPLTAQGGHVSAYQAAKWEPGQTNNQYYRRYEPYKFEDIALADPKALEKIGEAIMRLSDGDWTPFKKQPRKKKKNDETQVSQTGGEVETL